MLMNHTPRGNFVQPFLDDSIALGADPSVIAPTVNRNIDWNWFRGVRGKFLAARKVHNNRKNGRAHQGRPRGNKGGPGRTGYDFFGYLRAFFLAPLFDVEATPSAIKRALHANPAFLVECNFGAARRGRGVIANPIPSFSALNEFENIMTSGDLWEEARRISTGECIAFGAVPKKAVIGIDPFPVKAYARAEKKKRCGCKDTARCGHRRREADRDAKYYRKGGVRILRAYRPALVGEVTSGIPLVALMQPDVNNVSDEDFEKIAGEVRSDRSLRPLDIQEILADAEFDSNKKRDTAKAILGAPLRTPVNPRRRKKRRIGKRGIRTVDVQGVPICDAGHKFEYVGKDSLRDAFVFKAPCDDKGRSVCRTCSMRCTRAAAGRYTRVAREDSPWIDWELPQHSLAFRMKYAMRSEIERIIWRVHLLGAKQVTKQGRRKVAGRVTRAVILAQMVAIVAMKMGRPDAIRQIRTLRSEPLDG
jgi:hypothetical protein